MMTFLILFISSWDDNYSAYWYFYGTRLYREDIIKKPKGKNKKKRIRRTKNEAGSMVMIGSMTTIPNVFGKWFVLLKKIGPT